jgi:hypothetical protein
VAYTFAVANSGGRTTSALLVDPLPSELALIDAEADRGSCTAAQRVVCTLGAIAPGETVTVTVVVQVTSAAAYQNPVSDTADPGVGVDAPAGLLTLAAGTADPVAFARSKASPRAIHKTKKAAAKGTKRTKKSGAKKVKPASKPRKPCAAK